jgi:hypothetical protein
MTALPLRLNQDHQLVADELQWIVQRRIKDSGRGCWRSIRTRDGLIANLGSEVFRVGKIDRDALHTLRSLPSHHPSAVAPVPATETAEVVA